MHNIDEEKEKNKKKELFWMYQRGWKRGASCGGWSSSESSATMWGELRDKPRDKMTPFERGYCDGFDAQAIAMEAEVNRLGGVDLSILREKQ